MRPSGSISTGTDRTGLILIWKMVGLKRRRRGERTAKMGVHDEMVDKEGRKLDQ
jgi:hypothetical protein